MVAITSINLEKSGEINPGELEIGMIVFYDPQYKILEVLVGGG